MHWLTPEIVLDADLLHSMATIFDMGKLYGGERVRRDEHGWIMRDAQGPVALPDPLVILPIESVIEDCRERLEDPQWDHEVPMDLALAPDIFHKADISGGPSYGVYVPDASADALLRQEWHETTFVNYLRICFRWAGFPGLERYGNVPTEVLAYLTEGLLPM